MNSVNPTSLMFGAVLFAFLFYITVRGDLAKWLGLLGLGSGGNSGQPLPAAQNPLAGVTGPAAPIAPGLPPLPSTGAGGFT
jgi:hypothetical protein